MKTLNLPLVATIVGSIAAIKELIGVDFENLRRDTFVVTLQGFEGETDEVWISKNQMEQYGLSEVCFVGNIVTVSVQKNIKDETYYLDADDEITPHDRTFDSFVSMTNLMEVNMAMKGVPQFIVENITKLRDSRVASTPKKEGGFHASSKTVSEEDRDAHIARLLEKYELTTNPINKDSIKQRLVSLGYTGFTTPEKASKEKVGK
jgi:hypothetical protein